MQPSLRSRFWFNCAGEDPDADLYAYLRTLIAPDHLADCAVPDVPLQADDPLLRNAPDNHFHGLIVHAPADPALHTALVAALLRVLRPGAHLLLIAPAEAPTNWRAVCAAEDAGFEVRDAILVPHGSSTIQIGAESESPAPWFYCGKAAKSERWGLRQCGVCGWQEATPASILRAEPRTISCPTCGAETLRVEHPTVKPVEVMRWLLREAAKTTPRRGVVLDPFLGSGTTIAAALTENVALVGIERDPQYAAIARGRVELDDPQVTP